MTDFNQEYDTPSNGHTDEAPWESVDAAPHTTESGLESRDNRIPIHIVPQEWQVTDEAIAALSTGVEVYSRCGELVRLVIDDDSGSGIVRPAGSIRIRQLTQPILREQLGKVAEFLQTQQTKEGERFKQVPPPSWCLSAFLQRGTWKGVPPLRGVVTCPTLRHDGSVLATPGYDVASGLLYMPTLQSQYPLITQPTQEDVRQAVSLLLETVIDFPFASDKHRAAWVAGVLTTFARHAYDGPTPLFLIDANTRGSGKSLLADVIGIIATGEATPRMSNPRDDDECRKRITSLAIAGDSLVLIDNINGELGCASLDAALTSTSWKDRILGKSEIIEMPLNLLWLATGNNVILGADTSRRVCHIRLESPEERPEERKGFKHTNLIRHVHDTRPELVAAAITILSAYVQAGQPDQNLKPWGSFDGWSRLVRSAVVWCGLPDPGETRQELMERSDVQAGALRSLIENWSSIDPEGEGLLTSEILRRLDSTGYNCQDLKDAILELCGGTSGKLPSAKSLGSKLRNLRGRIVNGKSLESRPSRTGAMHWTVIPATTGATNGTGSESANPADSALPMDPGDRNAEFADSAESDFYPSPADEEDVSWF